MADLVLSTDEARLADAVERGATFEPVDETRAVIRAETLKRALLGLPVLHPGEAEPRAIRLSSSGLRLRGVEIHGPIELDDAAALGGGYLPSLILGECLMSDTISLSRARLHHLSLAGSRLCHLRAVGIEVANVMDLSSLSSVVDDEAVTAGDRGLCWLELREARIGGSLLVGHSRLLGPDEQSPDQSGARRPEYALDLRAATIGNELTLSPAFSALGGVNIRSARIDKDLIASGARMIAKQAFALAAAGACIRGSALFNPINGDGGPTAFVASGIVSFLDATIEGSIEFRGASVQRFVGTNAQIGGAALFGAWEHGGTVLPFTCERDVSLNAAKVAGTLDAAGARVGGLSAQNAHVGGAALLRAFDGRQAAFPCLIVEDLLMSGTKVVGNFDVSGTTLRDLDLQNADVGGSAHLSTWFSHDDGLRFKAHGDVKLAGTKITGSLNASGASMRALHADNLRIGGAVFFRACSVGEGITAFEVERDVFLMGCEITGNLEMAGASIGNLYAASAQVGGGAFLMAWNGERATQRFAVRETVSLRGAKIRGNLEMPGATLDKLDAQNADIGGSAYLRAFDGVGEILPFSATGDVVLLGAKVRQDLDMSGAFLEGELFADSIDVGGNVWLKAWSKRPFTTRSSIHLSGSKIRNSLTVSAVMAMPGRLVKIDLSHSAVELLDDGNGAAWGDAVIMNLEGFRYSRLAIDRVPGTPERQIAGAPGAASAERRRWLSLQYQPPRREPHIVEFSPDVYDRLARAFRAAGYYADARAITQEKLRVERIVSRPTFSRPFLAVYAFLFDSGLSPWRAITTFLTCIVIGGVAAQVADRGWRLLGLKPVLVLETSTVNSLVVPTSEPGNAFKPGLLVGTAPTSDVDELPCGSEVEPVLYALDAFVPALEIHQDQRCGITTRRPAGIYWRFARAIYAMVGWVVTALTVLTVSGVARRHLEN